MNTSHIEYWNIPVVNNEASNSILSAHYDLETVTIELIKDGYGILDLLEIDVSTEKPFRIDMERIKGSLASESIVMPKNLSKEEKIQFLLGIANT